MSYLCEGILHIIPLWQGLVVGEHQGVHIRRHTGKHALYAVLCSATRVHELICIYMQYPVYPILCRQLNPGCVQVHRLSCACPSKLGSR